MGDFLLDPMLSGGLVNGILCKSLFSEMFWKFSIHEFWVLNFFCSSKTVQVTDFWLQNCCWLLPTDFHLWNCLLLWCHLILILGAVNCCQFFFGPYLIYLGRSCRSLILFFKQVWVCLVKLVSFLQFRFS